VPNGLAEGWDQYQKLVLAELERLNDTVEGLRKEIHTVNNGNIDRITALDAKYGARCGSMDTQIAILQLRASLWGFAAGALPVIMLLALGFFKH
jgi:hypothetical protein